MLVQGSALWSWPRTRRGGGASVRRGRGRRRQRSGRRCAIVPGAGRGRS